MSENKRIFFKRFGGVFAKLFMSALTFYCVSAVFGALAVQPPETAGTAYTASAMAIALKEGANAAAPVPKRGTELRVSLDGEFIAISEPILNVGGRTYLPLRALGDLIGAETFYDETNGIAAQKRGGILIETLSGSPYMILNKEEKLWADEENHDQRAFSWYWNNRMYLPLRQVCEALGLGVGWDESGGVILLSAGGAAPAPVPADAMELTMPELLQRMKHIADHDRQQESNLASGLGREGEPRPLSGGAADGALSEGGDWVWVSGAGAWRAR